MTTTILRGLISLAKRIGLWLVRRFAKWVATRVLTYMQGRIDDWNERKVKPKGRIRRWTAAVKWLKAHLPDVRKVAVKEVESLADRLEKRGYQEVAAAEREAA